jgi:small subunit ribosomal protein S16
VPVRIRLTRVGMTKQPSYRFVVTDSRNARDGRSIETLGHYNPRTDPIEINVNEERAKEWLGKGAQPSDVVDRLFRRIGVLPERAARPTGPERGPKKADKTTKAAKRAAATQSGGSGPANTPAAEAAAPAAAEAPAAEEPSAAESTDDSAQIGAEAAASAASDASAEAAGDASAEAAGDASAEAAAEEEKA